MFGNKPEYRSCTQSLLATEEDELCSAYLQYLKKEETQSDRRPLCDPLHPEKIETIFATLLNTNTLTFDLKAKREFEYFTVALKEGHTDTIKRSLSTLDISEIGLVSSYVEEAIAYGHKELAILLLTHYETQKSFLPLPIEADTHNQQSMFYCAVKWNNIEIAKMLVNSPYVNLNHENAEFCSGDSNLPALYYAMRNKNQEMVELLVDASATLGDHSYRDDYLANINEFKKQITLVYDQRLQHLKDNLAPSLPKSLIVEIVLAYADLPDFLISTNAPSSKRIKSKAGGV